MLAAYYRRNNGKISSLDLIDMLSNGKGSDKSVEELLTMSITDPDDVLIEIMLPVMRKLFAIVFMMRSSFFQKIN